MSRPVTIVIDGREVAATEGEMLHDAATRGDVEIPVFCYEPKLGEPVGACRMCLVEIEGIPKLQTSCSTPVRDGMVVHTRTDQVKHAQSAVVEFLLVNHPLDCPVCDKGGECPLQDITMGWGPGKSRVTDPKRHFQKPVELSPLVAIDRERCILCYRCVRFSQEVSEDNQLQLLDRGDRSFVGTFDDRPYVDPFHGNITDLCPVGALTSYTYRFRARPWDIEEGGTVCTLCPSQCNVSFTVRDEKVKRAVARDNAEVDDGWLCDRGRYGFEMFDAEERRRGPRLRGGPVGWDEAIAAAAEALGAGAAGTLRGAGAAEVGHAGTVPASAAAGLRSASEISPPGGGSRSDASSRVAAIVGDASNEEGYLVQRIVREALGSPHVDSRPSRGPSREALVRLAQPELSARVRDLDDADAILVVGTDPLHSSPILDLRIRKAMRRNGARLAVATDRPTALDGGAAVVARYAPGGATAFVSELATALGADANGQGDAGTPSERFAREEPEVPGDSPQTPLRRVASEEGVPAAPVEIAAALREAERVVIVWGDRIGREGENAIAALLDVAEAFGLAGKDGSGLLEIPELTNARGLREVGCLPDAGPGFSEVPAGAGGAAAHEGALVADGSGGAQEVGAPPAGMSTEQIRGALEAGKLKTLLLFGVDPLRDFPDTEAWDRALTAADHVICFSTFETATTAKADVVFPLETHAEKDGTVTHPDGRLQRVRPSAARPGDIRPNWGVLAELSLALGHDTGITSQPSALAALTSAVPFYAGIDDAAIAGRGVRWQDRDAASSLPQATGGDSPGSRSRGVPGESSPASPQSPEESSEPADGDAGAPSERFAREEPGAPGDSPQTPLRRVASEEGVPAAPGVEPGVPAAPGAPLTLGTYRDLWAGPITELNPPLKFLRPEQRVELSPADAERLGLSSGAEVRVSQNGTSVEARVAIRERVEPGVCFLIEGTAEGNANALLNGGPVQVEVTKQAPPAPGRGSDRASQPDSREGAGAEEAGGR
ncbi:MAG: molybdopterin-dependent oxidoreductase [Solirubrobacterales bacterium]